MSRLFRLSIPGLIAGLLLSVLTSTAFGAATASPPEPFNNLQFRNLGPGVAGGRVASVVGIPGNPRIYYIGAAGGGVWKTTDGGYHWNAIFTREPTSSISDVVLDPSNPGIVWVATGEVNIRNDVLDGAGLYRSNDAGKTWQLTGFQDAGNISKVVVDPHNGNIVWVAVLGHVWGPNSERGVFKTTDGGKTWEKVLYVNDHTGAIDLTIDGDNPQVLFAAMWQAQRYPWKLDEGGPDSGLYRSTDGGDTWTKLTDGTPKPPIGRISVAVAPSNPDRVYALIETQRGHGLLFDSNDLGDHWHEVSDNYALDVRPFYFSHVYVAPDDENKLYFTSFFLMESGDGGKTAHSIDRGVHVDHHAFWQDPTNPARMIQGNDGGVYLSQDAGAHWRFADTLPIEQTYQVAADSKQPYNLCTGLQDNDGWCGPSAAPPPFGGGSSKWFDIPLGDGQYVVPAPSDPDIIYADGQGGAIERVNIAKHITIGIQPDNELGSLETKDLKYRFNWTSPIAVSPTDANTVYLGGNVVFKSTDGGDHWKVISPDLTRDDKSKQGLTGGPVNLDLSGAETYDTLLSLEPAPTDQNVIWAGSDDGLVHVTRDGGQHWNNVTPSGAPKWGRVFKIGVSPFNAGTAYVAYDDHEMDDRKPYVYATDDYGQSWHSLAQGLPDQSVLVVREDPNQKGFLVLGNMTGLWYSRDDGAHWQKFQSGFPTAPVFDVKFVHHALVVATHGRGLFVLDNLRPFEEMNAQIAKQSFHLFSPSTGTEYSFAAGHAPEGPAITYYLKDALAATPEQRTQHRTPVKIVITDANGGIIATDYGPSKAGIDEFKWNMSYAGPTALNFVHPTGFAALFGSRGPAVLPGTYHVAVTAGGQTQSTSLTVNGDPNLPILADTAQANLSLALQVRNETSAFNQMLNRITSMHEALAAFEKQADSSPDMQTRFSGLLNQARALDEKITALKNSVYNPLVERNVSEDNLHFMPRLHSDLGSVVGFGSNETQPPTAQQLANAATVLDRLQAKLGDFNNIVANDVASYNKAALAAGAPTLMTGEPIKVQPVQM